MKRLLTIAVFLSYSCTKEDLPPPEPAETPRYVVLLDFDGHSDGATWNVTTGSSGLDKKKQLAILDSIRGDLSPFGVYVSITQATYDKVPPKRRLRVVFTQSSDWYVRRNGQATTGAAITGSFGNEVPCYVFTDVCNYDVSRSHRTASHEIGHTTGLRHQANHKAIMSQQNYLATKAVWVAATNVQGDFVDETAWLARFFNN